MDKVYVNAKELTIGYEQRIVISDINFTLEPGKTLALTGINGSGKTTLLKTLAGLIPPLAGQLLVFGQAPGRVPSRLAYLSQFNPTGFLLPLRVIDVVRMSRYASRGLLKRSTREDERLVREALEFMDIGSLAAEPLNALSGGQRQRVFLAYVLAKNADLILLDEPTSNLDVPGMAIYNNLIRHLTKQGAALVIATHNIKEAACCDYAMLLAQRVVVYGSGASVLTPETLLATFGIIARFEDGQIVVVEKEHGCH